MHSMMRLVTRSLVIQGWPLVEVSQTTVSRELRMAQALGKIGPSIFWTAVIAFGMGSFVGKPAVKSFPFMASISLMINFTFGVCGFIDAP